MRTQCAVSTWQNSDMPCALQITVNSDLRCVCIIFQAVAQKSEKIGEDEVRCKHMAELAQHDLAEALNSNMPCAHCKLQ